MGFIIVPPFIYKLQDASGSGLLFLFLPLDLFGMESSSLGGIRFGWLG